MMESPFVATWKLVSQHSHFTDGTIAPSRGENPTGILIYDAYGNMAVQLMRTDVRAGDYTDLTRSSTALEGFLAYFGRYKVDAQAGIVRHLVVGSSYPAYMGTVQVRHYQFEGDTLRLKAVSPTDNSTRVVVWQRLTAPLR